MYTPRETIMAALFALVQTAPGFQTYGRRVLTTAKILNQPAVFVQKHGEDYPSRKALGLPAITTIDVDIVIYWKTVDPDPTVVPETTINTLLDAVETVLQPPTGQKAQTLGGLVQHVWIEGKVSHHNGDQFGQGIAIMPVKIMVPC